MSEGVKGRRTAPSFLVLHSERQANPLTAAWPVPADD